jgi:glycosyltransferase involved in cell wall biosynthesis
MRILINAASAHMGGSVTYLKHVLRWLPVIAPDSQFVAYVPEATREKLDGAHGGRAVDLRAYPYRSTSGLPRVMFDQWVVPRLAARERADVLFSATGFGTWSAACPEVLLVRNFAYYDSTFHAKYRELGRSLWKNRLRRWHGLLSMQRADCVLFPTEAMRQSVLQTYPWLNDDKSEAVLYGMEPAKPDAPETVPAALRSIERLRERGDGPLLLNVSTYAVHKNLETLVAALPRLLERWPRLRLVTTTSRAQTTDTAEYEALKRQAAALGIDDAWIELGYVDHHLLPHLYHMADVYVFPSFTESFGHSMVEAMAAGLPVVAAGTPVNREVCSDAGRYFDTFDATDCGQAIAQVLAHTELREEMRWASKRRAQDFSWQVYAEQLMAVFRRLVPAETDSPVTS